MNELEKAQMLVEESSKLCEKIGRLKYPKFGAVVIDAKLDRISEKAHDRFNRRFRKRFEIKKKLGYYKKF